MKPYALFTSIKKIKPFPVELLFNIGQLKKEIS